MQPAFGLHFVPSGGLCRALASAGYLQPARLIGIAHNASVRIRAVNIRAHAGKGGKRRAVRVAVIIVFPAANGYHARVHCLHKGLAVGGIRAMVPGNQHVPPKGCLHTEGHFVLRPLPRHPCTAG